MINLEELMKSKGLENQPVKLDIGAGGYSTDDTFLAIDAYTECDITATMWELPLPDESVDVIVCSQALEHISKFAIIPTLREWHRVLKPGAKVQIIVPDLEWCVWWWLTHQGVDWSLDIIYGHQKHTGEYHQTGYTLKILKDYIDVAGGYEVHKMEYIGGDFTNISFGDDNQPLGAVTGRSINAELIRL